MAITIEQIKQLRDLTSAGVNQCKKALEEAGGDMQKAMQLLRKQGLEIASAKKDKIAKEGRVDAYVHMGNKLGVLVEINCETDFVARNAEFQQFTKDIAMQIAACNPRYLRREDVPAEELANVADKETFYKENCLMEQAFIKDPSLTINDYLGSLVGKFKENIVIRRFVRYKIGE